MAYQPKVTLDDSEEDLEKLRLEALKSLRLAKTANAVKPVNQPSQSNTTNPLPRIHKKITKKFNFGGKGIRTDNYNGKTTKKFYRNNSNLITIVPVMEISGPSGSENSGQQSENKEPEIKVSTKFNRFDDDDSSENSDDDIFTYSKSDGCDDEDVDKNVEPDSDVLLLDGNEEESLEKLMAELEEEIKKNDITYTPLKCSGDSDTELPELDINVKTEVKSPSSNQSELCASDMCVKTDHVTQNSDAVTDKLLNKTEVTDMWSAKIKSEPPMCNVTENPLSFQKVEDFTKKVDPISIPQTFTNDPIMRNKNCEPTAPVQNLQVTSDTCGISMLSILPDDNAFSPIKKVKTLSQPLAISPGHQSPLETGLKQQSPSYASSSFSPTTSPRTKMGLISLVPLSRLQRSPVSRKRTHSPEYPDHRRPQSPKSLPILNARSNCEKSPVHSHSTQSPPRKDGFNSTAQVGSSVGKSVSKSPIPLEKSHSPRLTTHTLQSNSPVSSSLIQRCHSPKLTARGRRSCSPRPGAKSCKSLSPRPTHIKKSGSPTLVVYIPRSTSPRQSTFSSRQLHTQRCSSPMISPQKEQSQSPRSTSHICRSCSPKEIAHRRTSCSPKPESCRQRSCSARSLNRRSCSPKPESRRRRSNSPKPDVQRAKSRSPVTGPSSKRSHSPTAVMLVQVSCSPKPDTEERRSCSPKPNTRKRRSSSPKSDHRVQRSRSPKLDTRQRRSRSPKLDTKLRRSHSPKPDSRLLRSHSPKPATRLQRSRSPKPHTRLRKSRSPKLDIRLRSPKLNIQLQKSHSPKPDTRLWSSRSPKPGTQLQKSCSPKPDSCGWSSCSPKSDTPIERSCSPNNITHVSKSCSPKQENRVRTSRSPKQKNRVRVSCSPKQENRVGRSRSPKQENRVQRSRSPKQENRVQRSRNPKQENPVERSHSPKQENRVRRSRSPKQKTRLQRSCSPKQDIHVERSCILNPDTCAQRSRKHRSQSPIVDTHIKKSLVSDNRVQKSRSPRPNLSVQKSQSPRPKCHMQRSSSPRFVTHKPRSRSPRLNSHMQKSFSPTSDPHLQQCLSPRSGTTVWDNKQRMSSPRTLSPLRKSCSPRPCMHERKSCSPSSPLRESTSEFSNIKSPFSRYSDKCLSPSPSSCSRKSLSPISRNCLPSKKSASSKDRQESPQTGKLSSSRISRRRRSSGSSWKKSVSPESRQSSASPGKQCVKSPYSARTSQSPKLLSPEVFRRASPTYSHSNRSAEKHAVRRSRSPISKFSPSRAKSLDESKVKRKKLRTRSRSPVSYKDCSASATMKKSSHKTSKKLRHPSPPEDRRLSPQPGRHKAHHRSSPFEKGSTISPEDKHSHISKSDKSPHRKSVSPLSKRIYQSKSPHSSCSSFKNLNIPDDRQLSKRKDRDFVHSKTIHNIRQMTTSSNDEIFPISKTPSPQKSRTPSLSPSPEKISSADNKYYDVPLRTRIDSSNTMSSKNNFIDNVLSSRSDLKTGNTTKIDRIILKKLRMKEDDKKSHSVNTPHQQKATSHITPAYEKLKISTKHPSGILEIEIPKPVLKTNNFEQLSATQKKVEGLKNFPVTDTSVNDSDLEDLLDLEIENSLELWESDELDSDNEVQSLKSRQFLRKEDQSLIPTKNESKGNLHEKGKLKHVTTEKSNFASDKESVIQGSRKSKTISSKADKREKRAETQNQPMRKFAHQENQVISVEVEDSPKRESPDESTDLLDGKDFDLRAALSRRRAERLLKSASMNKAPPARLLQSAFRGLGGSKPMRREVTERSSCERESLNRDKTDGRRVMVLKSPPSEVENVVSLSVTIPKGEREEISPSKVPIHFRLGHPSSSWGAESSRVKRKHYRKKKHKRSSAERGHKV